MTTELGGQRCARTVRGLITAGRLGPGEQLVEQSLVEVCGVSRNTLREGYRILADEGLVVHVPHRGVFVSSPGVAEVRDVYTARRVVECGALRERAGAGLAVGAARRPAATRLWWSWSSSSAAPGRPRRMGAGARWAT
ncbi:GntR family transcriptional regulator [Kytococcus sedentarius]|uniref:GntR family transcriptional regulator n=1 Tax=Kytococcus sedentarius TaxID=1276 RepID=UPI0018E1165B|nr:GntR family transcriptional regulator [Kytococcus sedentarius]QQB63611.1 GntR family transcriptional regulator [Kytococcus sedentarius]